MDQQDLRNEVMGVFAHITHTAAARGDQWFGTFTKLAASAASLGKFLTQGKPPLDILMDNFHPQDGSVHAEPGWRALRFGLDALQWVSKEETPLQQQKIVEYTRLMREYKNKWDEDQAYFTS